MRNLAQLNHFWQSSQMLQVSVSKEREGRGGRGRGRGRERRRERREGGGRVGGELHIMCSKLNKTQKKAFESDLIKLPLLFTPLLQLIFSSLKNCRYSFFFDYECIFVLVACTEQICELNYYETLFMRLSGNYLAQVFRKSQIIFCRETIISAFHC